MIDLSRTEALLGAEALRRLASSYVAVVGVGGVGSWCAEALVRSGVGRLLLVDDDFVAPSNVNRQCPATALTLGQPKVVALKARLLAINPDCLVEAVQARVAAPEGFPVGGLLECDLVVDAIDSVDCKAELVLGVTAAGVPLVSSLGAALRLDPTKVVVRRFDRVDGDGLARALRQRFKRLGRYPARPFPCVASTEVPKSSPPGKPRGSVMSVTCAFGMALASEGLRLLTTSEAN